MLESIENRMKVLHISSYPPKKCGIADYLDMLVSEFEGDHKILSFKESDGEKVKGILDEKKITSLVNGIWWIKNENPDLIHIQHELNLYGRINFIFLAIGILVYSKLTKTPVLTTMHTYKRYEVSCNPKEFLKWLGYQKLTYSLIKAISEKIIVHNKETKEKMGGKDNVEVIPHGVKISQQKEDVRKDYGFSGKIFLLCIGFITPNKGLKCAVSAMKHLPNSYKLLIIGSLPSGFEQEGEKYFEELEEKVNRENLNEKVALKKKFLSEQEIENLLYSADISLFPYQESNQSGMMHRAIGAGNKIICTDLDVFKNLLEDYGAYFKKNNSEDLASKIKNHKNISSTEGLSKNLTWEKIAKEHRELYSEITANNYP